MAVYLPCVQVQGWLNISSPPLPASNVGANGELQSFEHIFNSQHCLRGAVERYCMKSVQTISHRIVGLSSVLNCSLLMSLY